jgi:aryl sulfotransferase
VQEIVRNLIFSGQNLTVALDEISPWLDMRNYPLELVLTRLEQQTHRRSMKTHLPLDGLPFHPSIKYLYVGRDPRDVFMSFHNFYSNFTPQAIDGWNGILGRVGDELARCPDDIHTFWRTYMTKGSFPWETEGFPTVSVLHHVQS